MKQKQSGRICPPQRLVYFEEIRMYKNLFYKSSTINQWGKHELSNKCCLAKRLSRKNSNYTTKMSIIYI
jgi:hypothetical protein